MVNNWIKYVKSFQKANKIGKYGDALKLAGPSYRKQCGLKKKSPKKHKKHHKKKSHSKKKKKRSKGRKKRSPKTA